jgi:hypothetical protein
MKTTIIAAMLAMITTPALAGYDDCVAEAEGNGHWGPEAVNGYVQARLDECAANGYWDEVRRVSLDQAFRVYCTMTDIN